VFARQITLLLSAIVAAGLCVTAPASAGRPERRLLLQADEVLYDANTSVVSAKGHVEIDDQGRSLFADTITYDQARDQVTALGHVIVLDEKGNASFADHIVLADRMRNGVLSGFGALIGKNGRLAAASARRINGTVYVTRHTAYSPCRICDRPGHRTPLWQVKSERVVYDQTRHKVRFKDASVDLFGVPVLWSPYLSLPDATVHHASGLLMPVFGGSTTPGYFVRLPVYIAFSDSNDATIAPMTSLKGDAMLSAEYRQRWQNGGFWLQGSGTYNPNGGLGGTGPQTYGHLFGSGRAQLDDIGNWRSGFDLQLTTNNAYMKDFGISQLDRLVNDLFVENQTGRSRFSVTAYYFQGLRGADNPDLIPFVLPEVDFNYIPSEKVGGGRLQMHLNSVILGQTFGPQSRRLTQEMDWRRSLISADGQVWTLQADIRGDLYHVDNDGRDGANYPTVPLGSRFHARAIPYLALDWRWPFLSSSSQGTEFLVEPIAQVIAQSYGGNIAGLPIEDARSIELNDTDIFSFNKLPGYDLIESGPRANYGFKAEALFTGGEAQFQLAQSYRLRQDPILNSYTGETEALSDIVGRFDVRFPHFALSDRISVDRHSGSVDRNEVFASTSLGRTSFEASYVQLPPNLATGLGPQKQINTLGDINFLGNWQLFVATQQNALTGKFFNMEYALGYQIDCFGIALGYRRRYTSDPAQGIPSSTDLLFGLVVQTDGQQVNPAKIFPDDVFGSQRR